MVNVDIAAAAERSLTSQAELLTTLSLAVIGGLLAVIIRVRTHNASGGNKPIEINHMWLMWIAMGCAAVSIATSYLISGMLIQMSPLIFSHNFDPTQAFSNQEFGDAPILQIQTFSFLQFLTFALSIIFGIFFVVANSRS